MKFLILLPLLLANIALADCPKLGGTYKFEKDWNGILQIKQNGCESISLIFKKVEVQLRGSKTKRKETILSNYTWALDGKAHEGWQGTGKLANLNSKQYSKAQFKGSQLLFTMYSGSQAECGIRYNFQQPKKCKIFEYSMYFDDELESFIWTQTGFDAAAKGWISKDEFLLIKQ